MKKLIFLLVLSIFTTTSTFAQFGSGITMPQGYTWYGELLNLSNTTNYVSGHFTDTITNSGTKYLSVCSGNEIGNGLMAMYGMGVFQANLMEVSISGTGHLAAYFQTSMDGVLWATDFANEFIDSAVFLSNTFKENNFIAPYARLKLVQTGTGVISYSAQYWFTRNQQIQQ